LEKKSRSGQEELEHHISMSRREIHGNSPSLKRIWLSLLLFHFLSPVFWAFQMWPGLQARSQLAQPYAEVVPVLQVDLRSAQELLGKDGQGRGASWRG